MRARIAAALACCLMALPAQAQTAAGAPMTLPATAMQQLGLQAVEQGRFDLALQIADALIAANPSDTFAYYLKATALYRTNRLPEAQKAAKLSYRYSHSPEQSYQAARLTALAAYNSQHYGTAQWWLRRAAQYAPEEARRDRSIAEFNAVRAKNPMSVELSFSIVPSDNVNSGSSGSFNYIDGVPYVGILTPDALALPGWIAEASVDLQYRLSATDSGSTFVGLYVFAQDITLSDSAKADLGDYPAPDLGARRAEVSLRHSFAKAGGVQSVTVAGIVGIQQEGGVEEQTYGRLRLGYARALDAVSLFNIAVAAETREAVRKQEYGDQIYTLRGSYVRSLKSADVATATLFASQFRTSYDGQSSVTFGGDLSYDIARDFGPMNLSLAAGAYVSQFDGYTIATIEVPGGRQDTTGYLQVQALFPGVEYSGFAPVLTLQRKVTSSNVSRFDSKETSISLGIQSTF
jgi:tetratricopeptide (TPR) repeat protein